MTNELKILMLEDEPADAEYIAQAMRRGGLEFSFQRVETREAFIAALEEFRPDIILADFRLPTFDGLAALHITLAREPRVPFVFVSGTMSEEIAVERVKAGANDYILKDRLGRLPSAVHRALAESEAARQRRVMEKSLRESEEMFRTMANAAQDAVILVDGGALISFWNPAAERIFGLSSSEVEGRNLIDLCAPERLRDCYRTTFNKIREAGPGSFAGKTIELRAERHDGGEFPLEVSIAALSLDDRWQAMCSARDISERKRIEAELASQREELEQRVAQRTAELEHVNESLREANRRLADAHNQLLQSERLAALGRLAGGVAHEINNPLAFVCANFATLKRHFDELLALRESDEKVAGHDGRYAFDLQEMKADADALMAESKDGLARMKKVVNDLREFAGIGINDWQRVDLNAGLDATITLLQWRLKNADIVRDFGELPEVECLPSEINLVFMNLLLNAAEAIIGHGSITVRTRAVDGGVRVEVADTGHGIGKDSLPRIFDPFYSTRTNGQSVGLGLSLAYGIIQRHHGRIEVTSEVGKGASFRLWIPCDQAGRSSENEPAAGAG
jgi:PAS domain S-box-containing protein